MIYLRLLVSYNASSCCSQVVGGWGYATKKYLQRRVRQFWVWGGSGCNCNIGKNSFSFFIGHRRLGIRASMVIGGGLGIRGLTAGSANPRRVGEGLQEVE